MAKTLWDINFSTLDTTQSNYNGWATKATNTLNLATGVYNPNGSRLFVNAVDIDWNGATWSSVTGSLPSTNTTGDLL